MYFFQEKRINLEKNIYITMQQDNTHFLLEIKITNECKNIVNELFSKV